MGVKAQEGVDFGYIVFLFREGGGGGASAGLEILLE
jgi:hypothetical protein